MSILPQLLRAMLCMALTLVLSAPTGIEAAPDGASLYALHCAQCHGAQLQGGNAHSLVDGVWQFGGGRWGMTNAITHGITHLGMPSSG